MGERMVQFTPRKNVNAVRQRKSRLQNRQQLLSVPSKSVRNESVNPSCQETCSRSFREYLFNATLHGLKYMGDGTLTLFERYKTNRCYGKYKKSIAFHSFVFSFKHIFWFNVRHCGVIVSVFHIEHSYEIHIKAHDHFAEFKIKRYKISTISR